MMYKEIRQGEVKCLSFLKGTDYVMYVGPELSWIQRRKLLSKDLPVPVIYLPAVLQSLSKDVFDYNFPGVSFPWNLTAEVIYAQIRSELGDKVTPESRLILKYEDDILVVFDASGSFDLAISYVINKCRRSYADYDENRYRMARPEIEPTSEIVDEYSDLSLDSDIRFRISESLSEETPEEPDILYRSAEPQSVADRHFNFEMNLVAYEAQKLIKKLLIEGCPPELIMSWLNESIKLSRLRITRQFKILLVDYDKEVKMGPLPKTVFLFFLRHPEGVRFSYLQDYEDELRQIYGYVSKNDDPKKMDESIASLIDPFSNSICEKCAAVKKAFLLQIADNVARNYYITGMQGGEKGISLDRSLVEWECEL